jgi:hypothetical protein
MVVNGCKEKLLSDDDRKDLEKRYDAAVEILKRDMRKRYAELFSTADR